MVSTEVKVSRDETTRETIKAFRDIAVEMLKSPLFQMVLCVMVVELGQMVKPDGKNQLISDITGSAIEGVVISSEAIKSLGEAASVLSPLAKLFGK